MTLQEFAQLIDSGKKPVIEFTNDVDAELCDFDPGTKAKCISAEDISEKDFEAYCIRVDFSEFKEYNQELEKSDWLDGEKRVKWSESKYYPRDCKHQFFLDERNFNSIRLVDNSGLELFEEFKKSGVRTPYLNWLERELLDCRRKIV